MVWTSIFSLPGSRKSSAKREAQQQQQQQPGGWKDGRLGQGWAKGRGPTTKEFKELGTRLRHALAPTAPPTELSTVLDSITKAIRDQAGGTPAVPSGCEGYTAGPPAAPAFTPSAAEGPAAAPTSSMGGGSGGGSAQSITAADGGADAAAGVYTIPAGGVAPGAVIAAVPVGIVGTNTAAMAALDAAISFFSSLLEPNTGATAWHLAAERPGVDALRQLHHAYSTLVTHAATRAPSPMHASLVPPTPHHAAAAFPTLPSAAAVPASSPAGSPHTAATPPGPHFRPTPSHPFAPWSLGDKQGRTPLLICCAQGNTEGARDLLAWGSNPVLERDKRGRTALHLAAQSGGVEVARALVQWAKDNDPTLPSRPPEEAAATALQGRGQGPDQQPPASQRLDQQSRPSQPDWPGQPASQPQQPSSTQPPDQQSILPVAPDRQAMAGLPRGFETSALSVAREQHQAAQQQRLQAAAQTAAAAELRASQLCRSLADAADACGLTPLHYATAADDAATCQLLLACGAAVTAAARHASYDNAMPCNSRMTPLHVAAMNNAFMAAHCMLVAWNRLSVQERVEQFPLDSRAAAVPLQQRSGLDPRRLVDKQGKTACAIAASRRYDALAELLDPSTPLPGEAPEDSSNPDAGPDGNPKPMPPAFLCCPITMDLMEDPVVISDGHSYERAAIEKWLSANSTSPLTNMPLTNDKAVFPNRMLQQAIAEWRTANGLPPRQPPKPKEPKPSGQTRITGHGPQLQGGLGDGFIREMAAAGGGAANGVRW